MRTLTKSGIDCDHFGKALEATEHARAQRIPNPNGVECEICLETKADVEGNQLYFPDELCERSQMCNGILTLL